MLSVYDTLSRQHRQIKPLQQNMVKMYSCGPTVYRDSHIGNLRSYLMADWIRRIIEYQGSTVLHVKNITDVGHMRQEELERGGDKVVLEAISKGKTPKEISEYYTNRFLKDETKLNILPAHHYPKATDNIPNMIQIVESLILQQHAYVVGGNVYFDISNFENYGKLSGNISDQETGTNSRIEPDPLKKNPNDFTLWKLGEPGRDLVWDSPWGKGFPGWHIECSAMSLKYLGDKFDLHTGGVDNIFPHHEGEIAQSEAFTNKPVVNYWVHGQHLLADGIKMAKSAGNSFTLKNIESQNIDPLAFRYLCLTAKYNARLNFTFTSLKASQRGLSKLRSLVWQWGQIATTNNEHDPSVIQDLEIRFLNLVNNNLGMPKALALIWEIARSNIPNQQKRLAILKFDNILGLNLLNTSRSLERIPLEIRSVVNRRSDYRKHKAYSKADKERQGLSNLGFLIQDTSIGPIIRKKTRWENHSTDLKTISCSNDVESCLQQPDLVDITIGIISNNHLTDLRRCLDSALNSIVGKSVEAIIINNDSHHKIKRWLINRSESDQRVQVLHTDHKLGTAAASNLILRKSRGNIIVLMDTSVEVTGNLFDPLINMLKDSSIGVAGPFGLKTIDLKHFHEPEERTGNMDAMQGYCFSFRRSQLKTVGLMRESFRFYRNLDIDYSFHFRDLGLKIVANPDLPIRLHEHRIWSSLEDDEREELSRKNFDRFQKKWGARQDLIIGNTKVD